MTTVHIYRHGTEKNRYMATKSPIPQGESSQPQLATSETAGAEWHTFTEMELERMALSESERERIASEIDKDGHSFFDSDRAIQIGP